MPHPVKPPLNYITLMILTPSSEAFLFGIALISPPPLGRTRPLQPGHDVLAPAPAQ